MSDCKYDKKIIHGSDSGKKALVTYILNTFNTKAPKILKLTIASLSEEISKLSLTHEIRNYCNCYGNLQNCFKNEDFSYVFKLDEHVLVLAPLDTLKAAQAEGKISASDLKLCESMYEFKAKHDEETRKLNPHLYPSPPSADDNA